MMRLFLTLLGASLLWWPGAATAQTRFATYRSPGYGCDPTRGHLPCRLPGGSTSITRRCPSTGYTTPSRLFGCRGELWRADGRLQDYAFAGALAESWNPPRRRVTCDVTRYGARGNGQTDATAAVQRAVSACGAGNNGSMVFFPRGTYVITRRISMNASVVLRGAGRGLTTLYFPRSLANVYGRSERYSYGDGFISFQGSWDARHAFGSISRAARRGSFALTLRIRRPWSGPAVAALRPGAWIFITQDGASNGALLSDLRGACARTAAGRLGRASMRALPMLLRHATRITAMRGTRGSEQVTVFTERPLPWNVSTAWNPRVWSAFASTNDGGGVEDLALRFPRNARYAGHWLERGYNAISISSATNCRVQRVDIWNADNAVSTPRAMFSTLRNIRVMSVNRAPRNDPRVDGHYGVNLARCIDCLLDNFTIGGRYHHSVSVADFTSGTVIKNGRGTPGIDINLDHHKSSPFGVLWTNLDVGTGARWWVSSGDTQHGGTHTGALVTFWNVYATRGNARTRMPLPRDPALFGGRVNIVGVATGANRTTGMCDWWGELPPRLHPRDLHAAMVATRGLRLDRNRP